MVVEEKEMLNAHLASASKSMTGMALRPALPVEVEEEEDDWRDRLNIVVIYEDGRMSGGRARGRRG
eukprot:scaffold10764_cov159-Ochromonas_danica.AAC.5